MKFSVESCLFIPFYADNDCGISPRLNFRCKGPGWDQGSAILLAAKSAEIGENCDSDRESLYNTVHQRGLSLPELDCTNKIHKEEKYFDGYIINIGVWTPSPK